jgi:hypothetical protein
VQELAAQSVDDAKRSVTNPDRVLQHGCEYGLKVTRRISDLAACCSNALQLAGNRATSLSLTLGSELERTVTFGASPRLGSWDLRRRPLIASPPTLERLSTAPPLAGGAS